MARARSSSGAALGALGPSTSNVLRFLFACGARLTCDQMPGTDMRKSASVTYRLLAAVPSKPAGVTSSAAEAGSARAPEESRNMPKEAANAE